MSRKKIFLSALMAVILLGTLVLLGEGGAKRPFKGLDPQDIRFASVTLTPPDITLEVTDHQKLAELLRDTVIYDRDDSYTQYAGQGVLFTLVMDDGRERTVLAYSPFLVIDGIGYRTAHDPCNALNAYGNQLLDSGSAPVILEQPPTLSVVSDSTCVEALRGGYSWQKKNHDGTDDFIITDSLHPLDCKEMLTLLETTEQTALLRFQVEPDEVLSVRCWSDRYWSQPETDSEEVSFNGTEITLKPGAFVYEVQTRWKPEHGYGGTASYAFYICGAGTEAEG